MKQSTAYHRFNISLKGAVCPGAIMRKWAPQTGTSISPNLWGVQFNNESFFGKILRILFALFVHRRFCLRCSYVATAHMMQFFYFYFLGYRYTSQKNISPKTICQKSIFLNVLFPELTIVRNHTCLNEHLPEITFARINKCPKLHFPESLFFPEFSVARMYIWPKLHFPENLFSRIYTCQNVHLAEITFPRKLIFQNLHLSECTIGRNYISPKTYFPEFTLVRMYI